MQDLRVTVDSHREVAEKTHLMALKAPEMALQAMPGQFVMIRVADGMDPLLRRPFSICGVTEGGRILVLYRVVGQGTRILSGMGPGDELQVLGPLGQGFVWEQGEGRLLLVSGGIGLAPLLFLSQRLPSSRVRLFAGYKTASEVVDFSAWHPADGGIRTSARIATEDGSAGHRGLVTDLLEAELESAQAAPAAVFACGPFPMLKRVWELCSQNRVPCQVSLEAHMACGLGACQACVVRATGDAREAYLRVCTEGPVLAAERVAWEAHRP